MDDDEWLPLRLRVLETSILRKDLGLAVLDAYAEVQFGRDVAPPGHDMPRVRLKEMAVSKLHATVFWDRARREWAVVDMGSKHGTFVQHRDAEPVRLSPPRTASIPRPLHHLDRLMIGSTTFVCHVHADRTPCAECTSNGQGMIPLFAAPSRIADKDGRPPEMVRAHDAKRALTSLRHTLLSRLPLASARPPPYVDRSARRRAMHPGSHSDSPGVRGSSPVVEEEAPLEEVNVGQRLLMKQGWQPGMSLGLAGGVVEPIEVHATTNRAGIGIKSLSVQEHLKERMWSSRVFN